MGGDVIDSTMSFRKYQSVEKTEVLPHDENERIAAELQKLGKTSATQLTDAERTVLDKNE